MEQRLLQHAFGAQEQGGQETIDPAMSVQEGVGGFERNVQEPGFDTGRQASRPIVHEALECIKTVGEISRWRRHEQGIAWPRPADPVLRPAEFARILGPAPAALQQAHMHFVDETKGERQAVHPFKAIYQGVHAIGRLADIVHRLPGHGLLFKPQQIRERRPGARDRKLLE